VVTGATTPGARVDVAAGQPGSSTNVSAVVHTVADSHGKFNCSVPTPPGKTVITATATARPRATGWAQETVTGT
jgi:hypothetical protein